MITSLKEKIKELEEKRSDRAKPFVIAIDGRSASGKTTLAEALSKELDCGVIHIDDFFLPVELRTEERYNTPGGNFHIERFSAEVIPNLKIIGGFSYRRFDCKTMNLGKTVDISSSKFYIVEGAYSLHPDLGAYADFSVFSDVSKEEQLKRIINRNGEAAAQNFITKWIPLEEKYFNAFDIMKKADVIYKSENIN